MSSSTSETAQRENLLAPLVILVQPFLEHRTEGFPDLIERFGVLRGQGFQLAQDAAGQRLAHLRDLRIVLQHLARDVQRQILAVDDTAHEAQIGGQKVGVVGDVDAPDIELDAALAGGIEEVERPRRGSEQQHRVGQPSFRLVVERHGGLVEAGGETAIRLLVFFRLDLRFGPLPERARRVDLTRFGPDELDRKLNVVRIGPDHALDLGGLEVALGVLLQMQHDLGPARHPLALRVVRRRDLEALPARAAPDPSLGRTRAAARHLDAVGHHEGGVESDAEPADQPCPVLGLREPADEGARPRARHRAEIVDQLLPVHADAGVADGERAGGRVGRDADGERTAVAQELRRGDRLVTQLVAGVGGVRDQLAEEDVGLGIDRMHHQAEELGDLGLEGMGLGGGSGLGHHRSVGCVAHGGARGSILYCLEFTIVRGQFATGLKGSCGIAGTAEPVASSVH